MIEASASASAQAKAIVIIGNLVPDSVPFSKNEVTALRSCPLPSPCTAGRAQKGSWVGWGHVCFCMEL